MFPASLTAATAPEKSGALDSTSISGICHTRSADGHCISLSRSGRGIVMTIYRDDGSFEGLPCAVADCLEMWEKPEFAGMA